MAHTDLERADVSNNTDEIKEPITADQISLQDTIPIVTEAEKGLKRKADFILLPVLVVSYLLNSLDRSNISNAHTAGLEKDLNLKGDQYNQILTYYQIPFIVLGPVLTVLTKQLGARKTICGMLFIFGTASWATGFAQDFKHMVICRVFVGAAESGFLASVIYYLSIWYTRKELATRIGIFYAALVVSSAFGGLIAFGVFHIQAEEGSRFFSWSYLFFIEGGLTCLWAIATFFLLPSTTQAAWFLNDEEKEVARIRLERDSLASLEQKFNVEEALGEFLTMHGYIRLALAFIGGTILTSNANFLAMIVKRLGYSVVKTNLYTVAPACVGAVFLVGWCVSSDHFRERGFHIASSAIISLIGYILLFTVSTDNTSILYFAMFLCTIGAYPSTPLGASWLVANIPNLNARALTSGLYIAAGNCGGLLSSNIYWQWEAPRYVTVLRTNIAMSCMLIGFSAAYGVWMRWENRRRDRAYGLVSGATVGVGSTKDKRFRFQV